jgi:hypothetical protein
LTLTRPARLALALLLRLIAAGPPRARLLAAMPFRARFHHRQGDALPFLVNTHNPDRNDVAHADHVVRTLDVSIRQLADMN